MSGLDNLSTRMKWFGGKNQQDRMLEDKLRTLKKALLYSYQAATAVMPDGREFRCLINPDKIKEDYDNKEISIPFKDVCLNSERKGKTTQGLEETGIKAGDIIQWKNNDTYWIVYLQRLEELAYFRAEIRRCRYEIEINGKKQRIYVRGPIEQTIEWKNKSGITFNGLNYTLMFMVSATEENLEFFHRFEKVKFLDKPYEVQAIDSTSTEGIIAVYLKEEYSNPIEEAAAAEKEEIPEVVIPEGEPYIDGDSEVFPYDIKEFAIKNAKDGKWSVNSNKARILNSNSSHVKLEITTTKSGNFILSYNIDGEEPIQKAIVIKSL